jgi:isoleucyl-tRNA synthetase
MEVIGKKYYTISTEEITTKFWEENKIFQKSIDNNCSNKKFVFYDGPPFATGLPHYGHILAGLIKDTIGRWATIKGYYVPRRAGWDTHGLPIEHKVDKEYKFENKNDILKFGIGNYNEECRKIVMTCASQWKTIMGRLGRWVDFDDDYKTMDVEYMSKVWNVFSRIYEKNMIYEGVKVMPYSIALKTPISSSEAGENYQEINSKTMVVKFKINNTDHNEYILAWTTTPWTLPSHYTLCVNKNITYCALQINDELYYVAKNRIDFIRDKLKMTDDPKIFAEFLGEKLIGTSYTPPFNFVNKSEFKVIADDFVTDSDGTGIVHIAPAFGADDYRVCIENSLITKELSSLFMHIDENGNGIKCGPYTNLPVNEINKKVARDLQNNNTSIVSFDYKHNYPYCYRSNTPLIYMAVKCWFLNVEPIKKRMVEINKNINWVPEHVGKTRFNNLLADSPDWCLSRNRYWGCPIPIWRSEDGEIIVVSSKQHLEELTNTVVIDLHRHNVDHLIINKNGKNYTRVDTVLDCWFESGCVPYASPDSNGPADFIAEGIDQTRGWFNKLLVIGAILDDQSPYKNVIVNGLVLATDGKKMSKNLNNYPDPVEIVNLYGADALRYYLIMSPASMGDDLRFKDNDVKEVPQKITIPITNSLAFFQEYHALYCKNKEFIEIDSDLPFDKWILKETYNFISKYSMYLDSYKINPIDEHLVKFINNLNNNYIRLNRDILKGKDDDNDNKCQKALSTLKKVLNILAVYLSPILPFLCENIYQSIGNKTKESIHLMNIKDYPIEQYNINDEDINMIDSMLKVTDMVLSIRTSNKIQQKKPLKQIIVYGEETTLKLLNKVENYIASEGNILDVSWEKWVPTMYEYKYEVKFTVDNNKTAGRLFTTKINEFKKFISELSQPQLEYIYNGNVIKWNTNPKFSFDYSIDKSLVTVEQKVVDKEDGFKLLEDSELKIKIKLNIQTDETTEELFVAKTIASMFQRMRKNGGFRVIDSLRLCIKENEFQNIVLKHMEYIMKTTRVPVEVVKNDETKYDYHETVKINDVVCEMYLVKNV